MQKIKSKSGSTDHGTSTIAQNDHLIESKQWALVDHFLPDLDHLQQYKEEESQNKKGTCVYLHAYRQGLYILRWLMDWMSIPS